MKNFSTHMVSKKKCFGFSVLLILFTLIVFPYSTNAASCPATSDSGVYNQGTQCYSAHGQTGVDVNGLQYTCGPVHCYSSHLSTWQTGTPNTCVYYDPKYQNCNTGWGGTGFNPASGCFWHSGTSGTVPCPGSPGSPVSKHALYIHVNGASNPVTIQVSDNGYGKAPYTTDSNGNIQLTSFSGDTVNMYAPTNDPNYTVAPASVTTTVNVSWGCGASASNPCTFTATPKAAPSPSTSPSSNPSPSAAPSPSASTVSLSVVLGLPGIGYNGNAPVHTKRTATIELYDPSVTNPGGPGTKPLAAQAITLQYQTTGNSAGYFAVQAQTLTLPANPPSGNNYQILVKVPQYLYKLETNGTNTNNPTTFTLAPNASVTLPILYMDPGDLVTANGGANLLNLDDYTQLKTCFGNSSSCPTTTDGIPVADLNDDGSVNIVDFNIMLRSLANFINNESSHCNGLECQGD